MRAFVMRFSLLAFIVFTTMAHAQEKENIEETLTHRKIDSLLNKAAVSIADLEYAKAIDLLEYSRRLAKNIDHKKRIGLTTGTLAKLYFQLGDYEKAEVENKKAIAVEKAGNFKILLGQSYILAAQLEKRKENIEGALSNIERAKEQLLKSNRPDLLAQLNILQGSILEELGRREEALEKYTSAVQESTSSKNDYLQAQALIGQSSMYAILGNIDEATASLNKASEILKTNDFKNLEKEKIETQSRIAYGQNDYKTAFDLLESYQRIQAEEVASTPVALETTGFSPDLELMSEQLREDVKREKERSIIARNLALVLTIAICSILALLVLSLYKNNNLRAKANELLQAKNVELVIARDNAEKASTVKAQFLSTITHELRTPMYAVTGLTHLLLSEDPRPDQKKHLDSLKFSGEYLLSLINNILDLNKLEANKVEVEETAFSLKKRIEDVLFALGKSARDKGNKVHLEFDEDIPTEILGDPLMISQILINLIGNAIKFTRDGDVFVRVQKIKQGESDINLHFEIEDTGEGISKKKQKTIFQNFTQGSVAINRKFGGTGLGLSIVKNLLDLLNSKIRLDSTLGKGTTFKFDIKYNLIAQFAGDENPHNIIYDIDYAALENRHILVVEDNKINQMITRKILEKNKMTCETADNGEIAVDKARNSKFDLILMDIHMPGISGIEATEQIRTFDQNIPILALTAVTIDDNIDEFYEAGFNDIIPKPYKIEEFFQKIHNGLKNENAFKS